MSDPVNEVICATHFILNTGHAVVKHSKIYQLCDNPNIFTWVRAWTDGRFDKPNA